MSCRDIKSLNYFIVELSDETSLRLGDFGSVSKHGLPNTHAMPDRETVSIEEAEVCQG